MKINNNGLIDRLSAYIKNEIIPGNSGLDGAVGKNYGDRSLYMTRSHPISGAYLFELPKEELKAGSETRVSMMLNMIPFESGDRPIQTGLDDLGESVKRFSRDVKMLEEKGYRGLIEPIDGMFLAVKYRVITPTEKAVERIIGDFLGYQRHTQARV